MPKTDTTLEQRFWAKVAVAGPDDCWQWQGSLQTAGYGNLIAGGQHILAHRFAYELMRGPIPMGLQLDHLCRNRACVNPAHLEAVTLTENILRGESFSAVNARKLSCIHGHPFDEGNTYHRPNGTRECKACGRVSMKRYLIRRRQR